MNDITKLLSFFYKNLLLWLVFFTLIIIVCSGGFLFVSSFFTIMIYLLIFFKIIPILNPYEKLFLNKKRVSLLFTIFANTVLIMLILVVLAFFDYYRTPNYKVKKLKLSNNNKSLYVANLPQTYSFNNYLNRRFWQHNDLNKQINKKIEKKKINSFFIEKQTIYLDYELNNFDFDFLSFFASINKINNIFIKDIINDKSLIDTFIIRNKIGDKRMCYIENIGLNNYFYNNQFEIFIEKENVEIRSLYKIPNEINLEKQINIMISECSND